MWQILLTLGFLFLLSLNIVHSHFCSQGLLVITKVIYSCFRMFVCVYAAFNSIITDWLALELVSLLTSASQGHPRRWWGIFLANGHTHLSRHHQTTLNLFLASKIHYKIATMSTCYLCIKFLLILRGQDVWTWNNMLFCVCLFMGISCFSDIGNLNIQYYSIYKYICV